jgi:hypothetical protein
MQLDRMSLVDVELQLSQRAPFALAHSTIIHVVSYAHPNELFLGSYLPLPAFFIVYGAFMNYLTGYSDIHFFVRTREVILKQVLFIYLAPRESVSA